MMANVYVEQDCTIEHEGRKFESGGAVVTPEYAIGYLADERTGELVRDRRYFITDWHGKELGPARIVSTWRLPLSYYVSTHMHQVEATINGIVYTGRTCGVGMIWKGKAKAKQG